MDYQTGLSGFLWNLNKNGNPFIPASREKLIVTQKELDNLEEGKGRKGILPMDEESS